jgi:tetratricopeptide (TPR) repeat protein
MDIQSLYDQAVTAHRQGDLAGAEQSYLQILGAQPAHPGASHSLGQLRVHQGRFDEALQVLDSATAFRPTTAAMLCTRAGALRGRHRDDEALTCLNRALALEPGFTAALYARAELMADHHRIADWFSGFARFAEKWHGDRAWTPHGAGPPPPHKAQHDREQQDYQRSNGIVPKASLHIEGGERLAGPAVNPVNAASAAQTWRTATPQIVVIDDLLTREALEALRRFSRGSTVWRAAYDAGYIGAFPANGFAVPLLAQIVEEFRTVFSDICGSHTLKTLWGFKYDSSLDGIGIHADEAAVNVNFWITPDEANLDSQSGGLVVWDVAAPLDWAPERFNHDETTIRDFLKQSGARSITIPHRANRAVIFDSDLFHQTDVIRFKEGYLNRRINVTLLFGMRNHPAT